MAMIMELKIIFVKHAKIIAQNSRCHCCGKKLNENTGIHNVKEGYICDTCYIKEEEIKKIYKNTFVTFKKR